MPKRRVEYVAARGRKQITAELPLDLAAELERIAQEEDVSRQSIVIRSIRDYVKKYPRIVQLREMVN